MAIALGHYVLVSASEAEEEVGGSVGLIISMGKKYYLESIGVNVAWPQSVTIGNEVVLANEDDLVRVGNSLYGTPASNVVCLI